MLKDRVISIDPIEFEESTRDIILNNTKTGKTYCSTSFKKILNISNTTVLKNFYQLTYEGYFEDLGVKNVTKIHHWVRVFKKL